MYEKVDCKYNKFWVPLVWANSILAKARKDNFIKTDLGLMVVMNVSKYQTKRYTDRVFKVRKICDQGREILVALI